MRLGGGRGGEMPPNPEEERKLANMAVMGSLTTYGIVILAINAFPYIIEQFGFPALK